MAIKHGNHTVYNLNYYIVFCSKRRKSVLVGDIARHCSEIITEEATKVKLKIENIRVQDNYVHVFVSAHPKISPHQIVKRFKGMTAKILRQKYPQLLRLPSLWSSSYYVETIGNLSESVVKTYIKNQKGV